MPEREARYQRYQASEPPVEGGGRAARRMSAARRRRRRLAALILLAVALLAVYGIYHEVRAYFSNGTPGGPVAVTIPKGASLAEIAGILERAGVVRHADAFRLWAENDGHSTDLKPGSYMLQVNEPYGKLIAQLVAGVAPAAVKVTIPEGFTARQTAALLAARVPHFSAKAYIDLTLVHPLAFRFPGFQSGHSLEGFLFPATYEVAPSTTAAQFIHEQLAAFQANFAKVSLARAASKNLTPYDVLIIASMIEREAKVASERPLIGAVIWNRLHLGMPLQIDATIEYTFARHKTQLTYQDLRIQSPYNTYLHAGLTPTPIANPGLASLEAAANPAHVDYLYYVARNDGSGRHYFSASYAQFLRDKARAQQ